MARRGTSAPKLIIALIHPQVSVRNRKKILSKNINFNATQNKVGETFPTLFQMSVWRVIRDDAKQHHLRN